MARQTGLKPNAVERATWLDQELVEKEAVEQARRAVEASAQSWERATQAQGWTAAELAWPARERNPTSDVMALEPRTAEEREWAEQAEPTDGES